MGILGILESNGRHVKLAKSSTIIIFISLQLLPKKTCCLLTTLNYQPHTLDVNVPEVSPLFARFPRSIWTEMLACDRSTPALCSDCVRVFSNLICMKFHISCQLIAERPGLQKLQKSYKIVRTLESKHWRYWLSLLQLPAPAGSTFHWWWDTQLIEHQRLVVDRGEQQVQHFEWEQAWEEA